MYVCMCIKYIRAATSTLWDYRFTNFPWNWLHYYTEMIEYPCMYVKKKEGLISLGSFLLLVIGPAHTK